MFIDVYVVIHTVLLDNLHFNLLNLACYDFTT